MELVKFFQQISSPLLSTFAVVFDFLSSLTFMSIILAVVFLFIDKKDAFRLGVMYSGSFVVGGLVLKNVFMRPRPFDVDTTILASRNFYSYGSLPSVDSINVFGTSSYLSTRVKKSKWGVVSIIFLGFITLLAGISKVYLAKNYLFDVLLGFIIGFLFFLVAFKLLRIKETHYKWYLFLIIIPIAMIFVYINEWGSFLGHQKIFEFSGFISSFLLCFFLEYKFIKFEIKNNLFFVIFKFCVSVFVLTGYYILFDLLFNSAMIVCFLKYFFANVIIFLLLPALFKYCQKYFYVFSNTVNKDRVKSSSISVSEKATSKIAGILKSQILPGDVVVLSGDLGAGKTVIVREILTLFGVKNKITSPTFTILNEYSSNLGHFYHFDMYRLNDESEAENLGVEEIINDKDSIKFIEWADKIPNYLPSHYKKITIVKLGKKFRNIILEEI